MTRLFSQRQEANGHAGVNVVASVAADEALVGAAKSGDHQAFDELWKRHSNAVSKAAYRMMGNRHDAEDVLQDAWMKAYLHLSAFDGRAKFATWLTRIAINSALMTIRRRRSRPETSMEITNGETWSTYEIADGKKSIEELYVLHETVEHIRLAICRLKPTLRHVVEMYQSDNHQVNEVAQRVGISVSATKSRLLRARRALGKALRSGRISNSFE